MLLKKLAIILDRLGKPEQANSLYEQVIRIREEHYRPNHPSLAWDLMNHANSLLARNQHLEKAEEYYRRAARIQEHEFGPDHPTTAFPVHNLGRLFLAQGRIKESRLLLEKADRIWQDALDPDHTVAISSRNNLAVLLATAGEIELAQDLVSRSVELIDRQLDQLFGTMTEPERLDLAKKKITSILLHLSFAHGIDRVEAKIEAYEAILDWKGRVFRSLTASRQTLGDKASPAARRILQDLARLRSRLSRELYSQEIDDIKTQQVRLKKLREERVQLERDLRKEQPHDPAPRITSAAIRKALPERSALIDFFVHSRFEPMLVGEDGTIEKEGGWREDSLSAWILPSDGSELVWLDFGPSAIIEEAVKTFLSRLVKSRGLVPIDKGEEKHPLRRLLWDPLKEHLDGVETLFISPDQFLGTLPFEVLQEDDGSYLLEHQAFVYLQNASALAEMSASPSRRGDGLLCVGHVDYRSVGDLSWKKNDGDGLRGGTPIRGDLKRRFLNRWYRLDHTLEESASIADLHDEVFGEKESQLWLRGRQATEERVKTELSRHRVAHIATHGFFQPDGLPSMWSQVQDRNAPEGFRMEMRAEERRLTRMLPGLLSGLVLAGANKTPQEGRDDGFLTAEELSFLDLSGLDLVVLSACETGLGRAKGGEGMLGLRRTLRQAGVRTVISSLWSVGDESTSELMQDFYRRLWMEKKPMLDALREARLAMLKKNRIENNGRGLPSTWGAFVLDGKWY